jgi:hypothetical protein
MVTVCLVEYFRGTEMNRKEIVITQVYPKYDDIFYMCSNENK